MKTLVIGGNGFIGSHLVDRLVKLNCDVTVLDIQDRRYDSLPDHVRFIQGDLTHSYIVREALTDVDTVYHLAWTTIHEVANQDPAADITANLIPSINLLQACRLARVRRIVFTSSGGTVYGLTKEFPTKEGHQKNPINAYGITKLAVEKYLYMFNHLHGLEYAVLRPSVPYGPRQSPFGRQGAVSVFLYRVAHGFPLTIWGDGSIVRDYFYISDLVSALVAAAEKDLDENRVFNIGGMEEVSLNQLVIMVERTTGRKAVVEYYPDREFDAPRVHLDISLAKKEFGWQPQVDLEAGLCQTWSWISSNILPK